VGYSGQCGENLLAVIKPTEHKTKKKKEKIAAARNNRHRQTMVEELT